MYWRMQTYGVLKIVKTDKASAGFQFIKAPDNPHLDSPIVMD